MSARESHDGIAREPLQEGEQRKVAARKETTRSLVEPLQAVRLVDVASVLAGYAFASSRYGSDDATRLLRGVNVSPSAIDWSECASWKREKGDGLDQYELAAGDIVVGMDRPWISTGFRSTVIRQQDLPALLVQRVARIRANSGVEQRYLAHLLGTAQFERHLRSRHTETTVPHISHRDIEKFEFLLPPLSEQRRIADILDKADAIRRKRKESIALTDQLLCSTFLEMFGDPVTNPKGWEVKSLGDLAADMTYGTSQKCSSDPSAGLPVLRIPNVAGGLIAWNDLKFAALGRAEEGLRLAPGDLLFVRTNGNPAYIARCAVFDGTRAALFASYLIRVRLLPQANVVADYVRAALSADSYRARLTSEARTTAGNYNISTVGLRRLDIPIPPLEIQHAYAAFEASARRAIDRMAIAEERSMEVNEALIHRAFSGQLRSV